MLRIYHASVLPLLGRKGGENLSLYRQEKLKKINNPRVYAQSLGAELLLMAALQDMGLPAAEPLAISSGGAGKPEIAGGPEFSLSHSGERVLCALSDQKVGADLQQIHRHTPALARRYFTAEEAIWLEKQRDQDQTFTLLWSLKESYLKFLGCGIAGGHLDSFTVRIAPEGRAHIDGSDMKLWYAVHTGYVMAVCSDAYPQPETIKEMKL